MSRHRLTPWILAICTLFLAFLALPWGRVRARAEAGSVTDGAGHPVPPAVGPVPELGAMRYDTALGRWVAPYGKGQATLTIDPRLQARLTKLLADYRVPWGATVLLEPRTGSILALAEYARREPARDLALRAIAPAASVFKIVTAAALLEKGVSEDAEVCYHGGSHRIARRQLLDDPRRDRRCLTLAAAMGKSANVVFAKLAERGLDAEQLRSEAGRWLFNGPIPFARPVEVSRAEIPDDPFGLATTAAGFGDVRLSPLHAALLAAIVANGGLLVPPRIVEEVTGAPEPALPAPHRVVGETVAAALARMMATTVTEGTARKVFRRDRWSRRSPLHQVAAAGKTGSLDERGPFRDYSWFVGYAPLEHPQVVVATVIVNERLWRVRAPYVAHEALESYFAARAGRTIAAAPLPAAAR